MFSAKDCQEFLTANASATEIDVELRSNGGYAGEAFDIHDQLRNCGKTVMMVGYNVKSAAVAIFLAADATNRSLTKMAEFLIHQATIDPWMLGDMNADELASLATELAEYDQKLLDLYVERTGTDVKVLAELMKSDKCITSEKAKELGFCATVLDGQVENNVKNHSSVYITPLIAKHIQNNKNKTVMTDKKHEETLSKMSALATKIENFFNPKPKISSVKNSDDKPLFFEGEKIAKDTVLYADEDKTTTVAEGAYKVGDETISVGQSGVVSEVKASEVENADVTKIKAELDAEKVKNAALVKEVSDAKAAVENSNKEVVKVISDFKTEFENLKKDMIGDTGGAAKPKIENNAKLSIAEMAAKMAH